jgi:hypothetical protein
MGRVREGSWEGPLRVGRMGVGRGLSKGLLGRGFYRSEGFEVRKHRPFWVELEETSGLE